MVVSSRRQTNVDKAVALLQSQSIQVTGTTCNVGKGEDREKLVQMVSPVSMNASEESSEIPFIYNLINNLFLGLEQTLEKCGGIDILVSNAAVNPFFGNIMESTEEVWDKVHMGTNAAPGREFLRRLSFISVLENCAFSLNVFSSRSCL